MRSKQRANKKTVKVNISVVIDKIKSGQAYQAPTVDHAMTVIKALRKDRDLGELKSEELEEVARKVFKDHLGEISFATAKDCEAYLRKGWRIIYPANLRDKEEEMVELQIVEVGHDSRHTKDHIRDSLLLQPSYKHPRG